MRLVTGEEMREIDHKAINTYGIPSLVLMENAGLRILEFLNILYNDEIAKMRILIFAGKGNNGGDGLVLARHLINSGLEVKVFLTCKPDDLTGDAQTNYMILLQMGAQIFTVLNEKDLKRVEIALTYGDLIIDAIYGTGFKGEVRSLEAQLLDDLNQSGIPIVAVDIPSGVEAATGKIRGRAIKAIATVTLALPKIGLCIEPGCHHTGQLWVGDISIPEALLGEESATNLISSKTVARLLPKRDIAGHKGTFGHTLIIGASEGMTGSVVLAGTAALRAGCGVVTIGVPRSLDKIIEVKTTEIMSRGLPETEAGTISSEAFPIIEELASKASCLVVGPGLSKNPSSLALVKDIIKKINKPLVLDADGLAVLGEDKELVKEIKIPLVLTPHPGEMASLMGITIEEVQKDRLGIAKKCAEIHKAVVVLKGYRSIVALPNGKVYINVTGNSGMGTAGSGDVLAGLIGSLVAQGLGSSDAALCGVYLHGMAGDLGVEEEGLCSLLAGDIIKYIGKVYQQLEILSRQETRLKSRFLRIV